MLDRTPSVHRSDSVVIFIRTARFVLAPLVRSLLTRLPLARVLPRISLAWVSLAWISLAWFSLTWVSLTWVSLTGIALTRIILSPLARIALTALHVLIHFYILSTARASCV
jgi:hypothetical protein